MGDAAGKAGGISGMYGWAFGIAQVGAEVASKMVENASGDKLVFNAQQVIAKQDFFDLTDGRTWTVRKTGSYHWLNDWDWELTVQAWGCAEAKTTLE